MLLSILVPVHNSEKYICDFLDGICEQNFKDFEIIFQDGQSKDNTIFLIQERAKNDTRIRLISEHDNGIYHAMNKALSYARGEWVYFMGCDDRFYDTSVLTTVAAHLRHDVDIIYGDVIWVPGGQREAETCTPHTLFNRNINHQRIFYRRSLFQKFGNYDLQYKVASDYELNIRFFCNDVIRKKHIAVTIAYYHAGGFSANKLDAVFWDKWKLIFKANFLKHMPRKRMYEKLGWYCRYLIDQRQYSKAFPLFWDVLLHTFSPGFVLLTAKQFIKTLQQNAG